MAVTIDGIVAWLENWFYKKEDVNTYLNAKANKNLTNANMNVVTDSGGNITTEAKYVHPQAHATSMITESSALSNIGTNADANQHTINLAIDTKIGSLVDVDFIVVVSSLPTASADTMGKMYLVAITGSGSNNFAEYVTVKTGTSPNFSYSWEKLGEISGSGLSVDWIDITSKPSVFPPEGHNHDDTEIAITDDDLQTDWEVTTQYEFNAMAKTVTDALDSGKADAVHTHTKSDITDFSHAHGQISDDGKITFTPVTVASDDYIVITDTNDNSRIKRVANLLTDNIKDGTAHSNIGSSANATQSTINTAINSALGGKASSGHHHGQVNNDGTITSTAVTVASGDNILITDESDSSKVKRVTNLLAGHIKDSTAHTNIGSSANDTQATINSDIDTALSNKANSVHTHNNYVTSIALVPKATDNTGAITLYYGDEPT